jgi:hypothetical protein
MLGHQVSVFTDSQTEKEIIRKKPHPFILFQYSHHKIKITRAARIFMKLLTAQKSK